MALLLGEGPGLQEDARQLYSLSRTQIVDVYLHMAGESQSACSTPTPNLRV